MGNQPIRDETVTESERTKEKERPVENVIQPIKAQITNEKPAIRKSELTGSAKKEVLCKQEKRTIKGIIASNNVQNSMSSRPDSDTCEQSTTEFADKLPLKTPICYSINQIEILQNLGTICPLLQSRRKRFSLYGRKTRHTEIFASNYFTKPPLRTSGPRQHAGNRSKRMVATTAQRSGRNRSNLPTMEDCG